MSSTAETARTGDSDPGEALGTGVRDQRKQEARALRGAFYSGAFWSFAGYGTQTVLRLGGNLIVTRLLFPEAFGLMALVNVFIHGLTMFSDLGLGQSLIQNPRGEEPDFVNTAWSMQVLRGVGLWIASCALAPVMAAVYGQPMLGRLIPVASFSALVAGFNSTALHTERRRLSLARMTLLSIAAQVVGLVAMVAFALRYRTVWALVVGAVVPAAVTMITSHLYLPGIRNRFRWNRVAAHELFHFGKWIFLSTALAFLGGYSDELLLGGFLSMGELGMYRLASFLAQASVAAVLNLSGRVLFPLYSRLAEMHAEEMRSRVWKYRLLIIMCTFPVLAGFVVFGDVVVDVLYDSRYRHSGWMLQILSVGAMASVMRLTLDPVLLAVGNSFRFTLQLAIRLVILVTLIVLGAVWFGMPGIIWAIALASITEYPVLILLVRRYGVWTPRMDALAVVGGAALIGFGFLLRPFLLNSVVTPFMTGLQRLFMPLIDLLKTLVYLTMMWIS